MKFSRAHDFWVFQVRDGPLLVAYLYAHVRPQRLRIQDFTVVEDRLIPSPPLQSLVRKLLNLPPSVISYRRRGIGSALLAAVVAHAESEGISQIEGNIVERDHARFPGLPEWYRSRGFALCRDAQGLHFHRG
ncbi:MAG: GNAT family N-acetyltransferase [Verrucomicrobia bacterium]|nr:GNAT family N-acetyltransferase [Verrucomicrobiota bacterium]